MKHWMQLIAVAAAMAALIWAAGLVRDMYRLAHWHGWM